MIKVGTTVYAAYLNHKRCPEIDETKIEKMGEKAYLVTDRVAAFGFRKRVDCDDVHTTPRKALLALRKRQEQIIEAHVMRLTLERTSLAAIDAMIKANSAPKE